MKVFSEKKVNILQLRFSKKISPINDPVAKAIIFT